MAPEYGSRIVGLVSKLQDTVGVEVVRNAASGLTAKQQQAFQNYMEGKVVQDR